MASDAEDVQSGDISQPETFLEKFRQESWQHTGRLFLAANVLYGLAGACVGNPLQAGAALSGLITNSFIARWGHNTPPDAGEKAPLERALNPRDYPVDAVSFWNVAREGALVAAGVMTAVQRGNPAEGLSISSSGMIGMASNSIIFNRHSLAELGQKLAPDEDRAEGLRNKARALLEHSTNMASMMSYPGGIAMLAAGLAADNIVERTLLVSGAALDLAGITCRSLAPKTKVEPTHAPQPPKL